MNVEQAKEQVLDSLKLITTDEVRKIWPISREKLSRMTNHRNEGKRLPSYKFGKRKLYSPQELMWFREKFRYVPSRRAK